MVDVHLVQLVWSDSLLDILQLLRPTFHDSLALDGHLLFEVLSAYSPTVGITPTYNAGYGCVGHASCINLVLGVYVLESHLEDQAI